jgi:hypothetical protein
MRFILQRTSRGDLCERRNGPDLDSPERRRVTTPRDLGACGVPRHGYLRRDER